MKPLNLSKPHIIIMVGIPGAGKSFFATQFADTFNAPYLSNDLIRLSAFEAPTYDDGENDAIGGIEQYMLSELLKTKLTIVYEGPTETRTARQELASTARKAGYEPLFVWVQTESVSAKSRSTRSTNGSSVLSSTQFDELIQRFSPPHPTENAAVISGKHPYSSQLKIVLRRLVTETAPTEPTATITTPSRHILIR